MDLIVHFCIALGICDMKKLWLPCVVFLLIGGCCGHLCYAQEFDRRNQTPITIESTSAVEPEERTIDTPLSTPADVLPVVTFARTVGASDSLIRQQSTVTEYWLVSEIWCKNCPAAKARFKSNGRPDDHVITIAEAKRRHGKIVSSIPFEYTTTEVRETINPPTYRSKNIMKWGLNRTDFKPLRETILAHLRGGDQHRGKHWQAWHLESWRTPQLYALHDDDHEGVVPSFEAESSVIATVEGAEASPELFAAVLAAHLMESSGQETDDSPVVMGSLFDFTINVEDSWKRIASTILTTERIEFASAGLSIEWGAEQTLKKTKNGITIQPPVKVTARKWVFHYSAALNGLRYADDLSSVTLDLSGAPDVTINLVSRKVATELVP